MRTEGRPTIPGHDRRDEADDDAEYAQPERVRQRSVWRQPRRHITADDAGDHTVGRGPRKKPITHRLAVGRKDAGGVHHRVHSHRENKDDDEAGQYRPHALQDAWTRLRSVQDLLPPTFSLRFPDLVPTISAGF